MNRAREPRSATPQQAQRDANGPRLLTQIQVCRRLGIGVQTWRDWRAARRVPAPVPNVPGRPRWSVSDIEDFERGLYGPHGRVYFGAARRAS